MEEERMEGGVDGRRRKEEGVRGGGGQIYSQRDEE